MADETPTPQPENPPTPEQREMPQPAPGAQVTEKPREDESPDRFGVPRAGGPGGYPDGAERGPLDDDRYKHQPRPSIIPPSEEPDSAREARVTPVPADAKDPAAEDAPPVSVGHETVYLPGLLADEYGIAASEARRIIEMADVKIDGQSVIGRDKMDIPTNLVINKTIEVLGDVRQFKLTYRG